MNYLFIVLAVLALMGGVYWAGYEKGAGKVRAENAQAVAELKGQMRVLAANLEAQKAKRVVVYKDREKVVQDAKDKCLDTDLPKPIFDGLQQRNRG
jgi:flagellar basal body-associated protein FliL